MKLQGTELKIRFSPSLHFVVVDDFTEAIPLFNPSFITLSSFPLLFPYILPIRVIPLLRIGHSLRGDFLCKGTACVRSSSTASLTVSGCNGSLPQIEDGLSAPTSLQGKAGRAGFCSYIRRLGIPFHPVPVYLPYPSFFRRQSCIKIIPRREAERASRRGK